MTVHSAGIMTQEPTTAWVANDRSDIRVVARLLPNGAWEPLFAVDPGEAGQRELPTCFRLNEGSEAALNAALEYVQG
jgi:hypothetical protein